MTKVIKRNNKREKYSQRKLEHSIEKACREAKLGKAKARKYAREVGQSIHKAIRRKSSVRSTELRKRALRLLESRSKAAIFAWRRHERKHRYR